MYTFHTTKDLIALCEKHQCTIGEIGIRYEMGLSKKSREEVIEKMRQTLLVMKEAVQKGIYEPEKSAFDMAGGDAPKVLNSLHGKKNLIMPPIVTRAMAYATATGETNSAMGRIVAFPTAGGSGVVPGTVISFAEEWKLSDEEMIQALFTASAVGIVIATGATFSAAAAGCQAEVGAAVAMSAAAITEMRGGTPQQAFHAASLSLMNYLGLACDPLGGLVAVPCITRNMIGAAVAYSASDVAISGVKSFIPFDEVVQAMKNVGNIMSSKLRETALGGLAVTKTGLKIRKKLGLPPLKKADID